MRKIDIKPITKYLGFFAVFDSWCFLIIMGLIHRPIWSEPISQFGIYADTRILFIAGTSLGAILWFLYSLNLDKYWKYTSKVTFLAGIFFITTGVTKYKPSATTFVFDAHNASVLAAAFLYTLPMVFIGYKKEHEKIARTSRVLFFVTLFLLSFSILSRVYNVGVIYAQALALLPAQIWLILTNNLLIEDLAQTPKSKTL